MGEDRRVPPLSRRVSRAASGLRHAPGGAQSLLAESPQPDPHDGGPGQAAAKDTASPDRPPPLPKRVPGANDGPKPPMRVRQSPLAESPPPDPRAPADDAPVPAAAKDTTSPDRPASLPKRVPGENDGPKPPKRVPPPVPPAALPEPVAAARNVVADPQDVTQPIPVIKASAIGHLPSPAVEKPAAQPDRARQTDHPPKTGRPSRPPATRERVSAPGMSALATRPSGQQAAERKVSAGRRYRIAGVLISVLVILTAGAITFAMSGLGAPGTGRGDQVSPAELRAEAAARTMAAAWVAGQVSKTALVSCDPVMCQALMAEHFPAGDLLKLTPAAPFPLTSAVVVATATIRDQYGSILGSVYAPTIIASFGTGNAQVDVRVTAQDGPTAYRTALSADLQKRKAAAASLLRNSRYQITISGTARTQFVAGQVDARLIITIAGLASLHPVTIVAFGAPAPGASPGTPLRSVDLAETGETTLTPRSEDVQKALTLLRAQNPPWRPAWAELIQPPGGQSLLRIIFAAPSPLWLLTLPTP
jgi:hypothetical protein